jgi:hypothetical protein
MGLVTGKTSGRIRGLGLGTSLTLGRKEEAGLGFHHGANDSVISASIMTSQ